MKRMTQGAALVVALACVCGVVMSSAHGAQGRKAAGTSVTPAAVYANNCATCHGKDGRSKTVKGKFKHAPDLTDAQWQSDTSDEHIFNAISNGHEKMPAFKRKLTAAQIESLVGYVGGLKK